MTGVIKHPREFMEPQELFSWPFKFIIFNDDSIIFIDGGAHDLSHASVAKSFKPLVPVGAGTIRIKGWEWAFESTQSVSLSMNHNPSVGYFAIISKALGSEYSNESAIDS